MGWWASVVNGERAVVALYIAAVIMATSISLLPEALSLSLLSLSALSVEIFAESSISLSQFNPRLGVSSGILLGAVTLPGLMMSRLIQLSRALSSHEIGTLELEHLRMQYWAAFACCVSVLGFLIWRLSSKTRSFPERSGSMVKLIVTCLGILATVCFLFFCINYSAGTVMALKFSWLLCLGFAAVILVQHMLRTFPFCASIGEALLVTSGLIIYFGDMVLLTCMKIHDYWVSSELTFLRCGTKRNEISIIVQAMVLGLLLFPIFLKFSFWIWEYIVSTHAQARMYHDTGKTVIFYISLVFISIVIVPTWTQLVLDFHMHPLLWVINFVFSEPLKRLSLCTYWVAVICVAVGRFYSISKNSKIERILLRKYYHLMAVLMFLPALVFQPKFLDLAFGVALAGFLLLEIIRVWRVWPLGEFVHQFMSAFTDHRDSELLIISHFSLLLGCALPIWMSSGFTDRPLAPFAGILSLGIGDSMASMVGHKYGVLRWSKTGKKTVEGTAAGITSVLAACSILLPLLAATGYIFTQRWSSLLIAVTVSGLLEAYTAQLDNAFIPLVFYSLLCL